MDDRCNFKFRMCAESDLLKRFYDKYVKSRNKKFLEAVEEFENIAERGIRLEFNKILASSGKTPRSIDQTWRNCKGSLYEYAICRALDEILTKDASLAQKINIVHGSKLYAYTRNQLVIKNWSDILPDVDFAVINKNCGKVVAVLSCKTSLRERLTETAFWARELKPRNIDVIFITTDKDKEITAETNRYIVMYVLDYTIITDPQRYNEIINEWWKSYGNKPDFNIKIKKVLKFADIVLLLQHYVTKCEG
jgi:type II restriction enzyme